MRTCESRRYGRFVKRRELPCAVLEEMARSVDGNVAAKAKSHGQVAGAAMAVAEAGYGIYRGGLALARLWKCRAKPPARVTPRAPHDPAPAPRPMAEPSDPFPPPPPPPRTPREILMPGGEPIGVPLGKPEFRRIVGGTLSDAKSMFSDLAHGGVDVTPAGHSGSLFRTPCGGHVGFRAKGRYGRQPPTLDVNFDGVPFEKLEFW